MTRDSGIKRAGALEKSAVREWMENALFVCLGVLSVFLPLYVQNKYFDIGPAKWLFYRNTLLVFAGVMAFCFVLRLLEAHLHEGMGAFWSRLASGTDSVDFFVLLYAVFVVVSTVLTPYRREAFWGFDGWRMGLFSQLTFVLLYFAVSRLWKWNAMPLAASLGAGSLVFGLGVCMRLGFDPLGMYDELRELFPEYFHVYRISYLSTIGQASWFSGYMAVLLPLGMFVFWYCQKTEAKLILRLASGAFLAIGFMSLVTQNTDSGFLAAFAAMLMLFWISFEDNRSMLSFLMLMMLCFGAFKLTGILQGIFEERAVRLDAISMFLSRSPVMWIGFVLSVLLFAGMRLLHKRTGFCVQRYKWLRRCVLLGVALAVAAVAGYVILNTSGALAERYQSRHPYLFFSDEWGNDRGLIWKCSLGTFAQSDIWRKLFGAGPDCFVYQVYAFYSDALDGRFGGDGAVLVCAHNEWLNSLLTVGIFGASAYLGIFLSAVATFVKNRRKSLFSYGIAICAVSYMAHNFFCYQQVVCTPFMFILLGIGRALKDSSEEVGLGVRDEKMQ